MTNRKLADILTNQKLLALGEHAPVQEACRCMWEHRKGSVLVIDPENVGELTLATAAYDSRVAGIVAGANGLGSGVRLGAGQYELDVALAGRAAVRRRRQAGAIVLAWTVRSPEQAGRVLRFVDNYIFESFVPEVAEHALSAPRSAAGASP